MKKVVIYEYARCSTCQKALKFLDQKKIPYEVRPIVETPPSLAELKKMTKYLTASGGTFRKLFNTSGVQYREQKIAQKLKDGMSEQEALELCRKTENSSRGPSS